jgi:Ribbon-helix-helix protein, copG family
VYQETNVRVPECAAAALDVVAQRRGMSRSETVRRILDDYLSDQLQRDPDDRWTHISTVIGYPAAPWRRGRGRRPRPGRLVRLRLVPGTTDRLRSVALKLPGQSQRGHPEYQARLLTDAVVTAIARAEPFTDSALLGLLPLLRQRAAVGLWLMAAAASASEAERALHGQAERIRAGMWGTNTVVTPEQKRLLELDEAVDERVAWHAPARFVVAFNLARERLSGADAATHEQYFYDQAAGWQEEREDLREASDRGRYRQGIPDRFEGTGRGATAVWRIARQHAGEQFERWLIGRDSVEAPSEQLVAPPGWWVASPTAWCTYRIGAAVNVAEPFASWLAAGRLLLVPVHGGRLLWPLVPTMEAVGWAPVPGIEPIIAASAPRVSKPRQLLAFVEAVLLDRERTREGGTSRRDMPLTPSVAVPVHRAVEFGLIDDRTRHECMRWAREQTLREMSSIIAGLSPDQEYAREALEDAHGNSRRFARITARLGIEFHVVRATWPWQVLSVADELEAGRSAAALCWLADYVYRDSQRALQRVTEAVWYSAYLPRSSNNSPAV